MTPSDPQRGDTPYDLSLERLQSEPEPRERESEPESGTELRDPPTFGQQVCWEEAERELRHVHRRAFASVLRQATAVAVPRAPYYGVIAAFPLPPQSIKLWRRRARSVTHLATLDGWRPHGLDEILAILDRPVHEWPAASRLAQAARRVDDCELARLALGYALLCEGEARRASRVFSRLLRRPQVLRHRWRALEGLALAHRALGHLELSARAIESAADDPRCGVSALVEALSTTLEVGDLARARRAAARIDMLVDPFSPAFAAALGRLRLRHRVLGTPEAPPARALASLARELARERRSPSGRVARTRL